MKPSSTRFLVKLSSKKPFLFRHTFQTTFICLAILLGASAFKSDITNPTVDGSALLGTWQIDLRAKPSDPPYYQEFVVTAVDKNGLSGTIYNSVIREGRINTDWGYVAFAFVTSDGQADYNTSGKLVDGKLEGATHSIGRDFMLPWRAEKKKEIQK